MRSRPLCRLTIWQTASVLAMAVVMAMADRVSAFA